MLRDGAGSNGIKPKEVVYDAVHSGSNGDGRFSGACDFMHLRHREDDLSIIFCHHFHRRDLSLL
jgi:hypothetical protein